MKENSSNLYQWALQKATSKAAPGWLGVLFCLELFLFLPLDPLLMFFSLQNRRKTFLYVLIATVGSTVSAVGGYLLGHFLWDLIGPYVVPHLISTASFARMTFHVQEYEEGAVFLGSLLPLPLKALSLVAGVFHLDLLPFIACVFGARLLRFTLVGGSMILWGERIKLFVERHFRRIAMLIGAKVAMAFLFFWALAR